ncbi:MAG: hypothetical protein PHC61_14975, partial [Chitinivibrionales bacterium]|nr:hypothetical protein [Chitinivibrionales bacterium]
MLDIKKELTQSILAAIRTQFPDCPIDAEGIGLEKPKNPAFGDIATPVAIALGKMNKLPPPQAAQRIMAAFVWDDRLVLPDPSLAHTIAGGFINFRFSAAYLQEILHAAVVAPDAFGRNIVPSAKNIL